MKPREIDTTKLEYWVYVRKSSESEDRQIASIRDQEAVLDELTKTLSIKIIGIERDEKTAAKPGREGFNRILENIQKGNGNAILCWKTNRLARNPIDGGQVLWLLQKGILKHIQTYFGRGYFPYDNMIPLYVEFGMANQQSLEIGTDTHRNLEQKALRGWYPNGNISIGYLHNPPRNPYRPRPDITDEVINDPNRFETVQKIFKLVLSRKHTPAKVYEIAVDEWALTNRHGRPLARSRFYCMLSDHFYYGSFEYPLESGDWYKGSHNPMITKEEFDAIQVILGRTTTERPKQHNFAFRGLMICGECGAAVTAEHKYKHQKNGITRHYIYYHCTKRKKDTQCSQGSLEEKMIETQIIRILDSFDITPEFYRWVMEVVYEDCDKALLEKKDIIARQKAEYQKIVKRLEAIIDMRADGEITEEQYKTKRSALLKTQTELELLIERLDDDSDEEFEKRKAEVKFAVDVVERFKRADPDTKKDIVRQLGSNLYLIDKSLEIKLAKPLSSFLRVAKDIKRIQARFEPVNSEETLADLFKEFERNPDLLPD